MELAVDYEDNAGSRLIMTIFPVFYLSPRSSCWRMRRRT